MSRKLGLTAGVITFLLDVGKGAGVVWLAQQFQSGLWLVVVSMLVVVAGHIWPVQLQWKGGRGVATSLGAVGLLSPYLAVVSLLLAVLLFGVRRDFIQCGLISLAVSPVMAALMGQPAPMVIGFSVLALMVLMAHRSYLSPFFSTLLGSKR